MKKVTLLNAFVFITTIMFAQNMGIGTTTPNASAILEIKASTKGLLIPRTSTTSRTGIVSPAKGLMVYDTTTSSFWFHNGAAWVNLSVATAGGMWTLNGNAGTNPATNFIGTTDDNPLLFRVKDTWAGIIDSALNNTAIGFKALKGSNSGNTNSAFGSNALAGSTPGYGNTAIGNSALRNNGTGANFSIDEGKYNTAVGLGSMQSNTTGLYNTAIGVSSLSANTSGFFNAAMGYGALSANTYGRDNTAIGLAALSLNVNGQYNTAIGSRALQGNTSGINNTASGAKALYLNMGGQQNTANGYAALYSNTEGSYNTATGTGALNNSTASWNTANGAYALYNNTTGYSNVAIGGGALYSNTDRSNSVAIGDSALYNNGIGVIYSYDAYGNTAVGSKALFTNNTGHQNTANGGYALYSNTTGTSNTANGFYALINNTTGNYNTANGFQALTNNYTGSFNTVLGYEANVGLELDNATAIGANAFVNASNKVVIGRNITGMVIGGYANWSNLSDGRFKENIKENVPGLEFITKLRPVTYTINTKKLEEHIMQYMPDSIKAKRLQLLDEINLRATPKIQTGFVAQDVEKTAKELGYNFDGVNAPQNPTDNYSIAYSQFIMPLVKAVQEQQLIIEKQNKLINDLTKRFEKLEKKIK